MPVAKSGIRAICTTFAHWAYPESPSGASQRSVADHHPDRSDLMPADRTTIFFIVVILLSIMMLVFAGLAQADAAMLGIAGLSSLSGDVPLRKSLPHSHWGHTRSG